MELTVLDNIPFRIDLDDLMEKMRVKEGSPHAEDLKSLAAQAEAIGKPRAVYCIAAIEHADDKTVVMEGARFTSRVLRVNLEDRYRGFPFIASCGVELAEWMDATDGMLEKFYAEQIAELGLRAAIGALYSHIGNMYQIPVNQMSLMSPGSLPDWPLKEQRPLFSLFGDDQNPVQVRLTSSLLMVPTKSVSGILFQSEKTFHSCELCPMPHCPSRRTAFDPHAYEEKFAV